MQLFGPVLALLARILMAFAFAFGVVAATKGLTFLEAVAMSVLVYAGTSQVAALEVWQHPLPWLTILTATAAINARMALMGATAYPYLRGIGAVRLIPTLALMADGNWAVSIANWRQGVGDAALMLGCGCTMFVCWSSGTALGHAFGGFISDPKAFGLDIMIAAFILATLPGLWRSKADMVPWGVADASALLAREFLPGHLYVVVGGLLGSLSVLLVTERGDADA